MSVTERVLVTGATGATGPVVVRQLVAAGYKVRALVRQPPVRGLLPEQVELVPGEVTDRPALAKATEGAAVVFHLAAKLQVPTSAEQDPGEYEDVNVEGTRCVTEACQRAAVRRLIFFSTISVYGENRSSGSLFNENASLHPESAYARSKQRAEQVVLAARCTHQDSPLAVVLRLAAVYGRRARGNYARLALALKQGWFLPWGDGSNRRTLVYDQDVAAAAVLAARSLSAAGQIYNVTDGEIHTLREVLEAICLALGRSAPRIYLPARAVRLAAGLCEDLAQPLGIHSPLDRAIVDKFLESVAVDGRKIRQELGYRSRFNLHQGWSKAVAANLL